MYITICKDSFSLLSNLYRLGLCLGRYSEIDFMYVSLRASIKSMLNYLTTDALSMFGFARIKPSNCQSHRAYSNLTWHLNNNRLFSACDPAISFEE